MPKPWENDPVVGTKPWESDPVATAEIPIGEQPLSWSGLGQTMLETGKGFLKGAGRDAYSMLGSPGTAYGSGVFGRKETPASEKITKRLKYSNTAQKIGGYAETGATLAPLAAAGLEAGAGALARYRGQRMPLPGQTGGAPYFREGTSYDPQFRGPVPPSGPYTPPAPTSWTQGTAGSPAQTPQGITLNPLGGDLVPAGQGLPKPVPAGGTGGGAIPMPGNPAAEARLKAQFPSRGAPAEDPFVRDEHGNALMRKGTEDPADLAPASTGLPKPVHEAAHAIDTHFSPRKAFNLTRHLQEKGIPFDQVNAMVAKARSTGDWGAINQLEQDAWISGRALEQSGAAKPGSLVPKTKYRPKTADYAGIEGIENSEGTWDRILRSYPRVSQPQRQLTAPAPRGMLPPPVWPPQPPVPNIP